MNQRIVAVHNRIAHQLTESRICKNVFNEQGRLNASCNAKKKPCHDRHHAVEHNIFAPYTSWREPFRPCGIYILFLRNVQKACACGEIKHRGSCKHHCRDRHKTMNKNIRDMLPLILISCKAGECAGERQPFHLRRNKKQQRYTD